MKTENPLASTITSGILIGHEIGEWAGFVSGRLTVKTKDGERADFHFGQESRGEIPKIGSLVEIEHNEGVFPKIDAITLVDGEDVGLYKETAEYFGSSLFLGKPKAIAVFVIIELLLGLWTIFTGLTWGKAATSKSVIFALCGMVHITIGYLVWNYFGE
jgi:hypothetical protein